MCQELTQTYYHIIHSPLPLSEKRINLFLYSKEPQLDDYDHFCIGLFRSSFESIKYSITKPPICIQSPKYRLVELYNFIAQLSQITNTSVLNLSFSSFDDFHLSNKILQITSRLDFSLTESLFPVILRFFKSKFPEINVSQPSQVDQFINLVEKSYHKHFQMRYYSDQLNLSKETLINRCKRFLGYTPHQILEFVKIDSAKKLLSNSNTKVSHVCYKSGFDDTSYFIKRFKGHTGVTPLDFRRQQSKIKFERMLSSNTV